MKKKINLTRLSGNISIPASKSDGQRAYLAAALATGTSILTGYGQSDDERAMLAAIQTLGAEVRMLDAKQIEIKGIQKVAGKLNVSAGESGLGFRLLTPVCGSFSSEITVLGEGSLPARPMDFFDEVLPNLQVQTKSTNGCAPFQVQGPMIGAALTVDGTLSSQFISGLLMALPRATGNSVLTVVDLNSGPYVEMTLETLKAFGIEIKYESLSRFEIEGDQIYKSTTYAIDADWSSASYWLVAAALGHNIEISGLKKSSKQADKALLTFLLSAGCSFISAENDAIRVDGTKRHVFEVDATDCPDLFPALVTLAAGIQGTSVIHGVDRLKHKESDRGLTLQEEFGKLGLRIDLLGDQMHIHGTGTLVGGQVHAHHDHRIAMCLAIAAATLTIGEVEIDQAEAVGKSYPRFWDDFESLAN